MPKNRALLKADRRLGDESKKIQSVLLAPFTCELIVKR